MTQSRRWDRYCGLDPSEIPAYTTSDAARYLWLPENTVRAWTFGRRFPTSGSVGQSAPLIAPADPKRHLLSPVNLLELHALRGLRREHDVGMKNIRRGLDCARQKFPSATHPLLDLALQTDGVYLFLEESAALINLSRDGQLAFRAVFEAHLKRIERSDGRLRFFPFMRKPPDFRGTAPEILPTEQPRVIAIDPLIAFGRPVISGYRVPTAEVVGRWSAGDSILQIAADYDCPPEKIEEALRWERRAA